MRGKTLSKLLRHAVGMIPENRGFVDHSESRNLSVLGRQIGLRLKKLEGFFRGFYEALAIKKFK